MSNPKPPAKLPGFDGKPTFLPTTTKLHELIPAVGAVVEGGKPVIKDDEYRK
jgi:hypothetical protein